MLASSARVSESSAKSRQSVQAKSPTVAVPTRSIAPSMYKFPSIPASLATNKSFPLKENPTFAIVSVEDVEAPITKSLSINPSPITSISSVTRKSPVPPVPYENAASAPTIAATSSS